MTQVKKVFMNLVKTQMHGHNLIGDDLNKWVQIMMLTKSKYIMLRIEKLVII